MLYFIVLVGLLPFAWDYSLFSVGGPTFENTSDVPVLRQFGVESTEAILGILWIGLYPPGVIGCLFRRRLGILLFGLAPGNVVAASLVLALFGNKTGGHLISDEMMEVALIIAAKVAFLFFILFGRMRSVEYCLAVLLAVALAGWQPAALFVAAGLGLRVAFLVIGQNLSIIRDIGIFKTIGMSIKTLFFWWPILLFAVPATLATHYAHQAAANAMYDLGVVKQSAPDGGEEGKRNFRDDLLSTIDGEYDDALTRLNAQLTQLDQKIQGDVNKLPGEMNEIYVGAIRPAREVPGLAPSESDCDWYDVPCHILHEIIESIKGGVRRGYDGAREKYRRKLFDEMTKLAQDTKSSSSEKIEKAKDRARSIITSAKNATHNTIVRIYFTLNLLQILSYIAFGLLCLKSFLYVFARVAFSSGVGSAVTLQTSKKPMPLGEVRVWGKQFGIAETSTHDFFVSRKFEPNGRAPRFSVPRPTSSLVKRIRYRALAMNRIKFGPGRGPVYFTAIKGAEFVEWKLRPGEVVVFDYKNFVGMSDTVKLSSIVSFRITSLLFGRIIFPVAKGPGTLILMSRGRPGVTGEARAEASVPPNRILAWHQNTRYSVESELNFVDIYLSTLYLKRSGPGLVVVDADTMGRPTSGLSRFVKYFLLPV
ncbi:MAG: hypothetical protein R3B57_13660 [Phycisphaerales bacterium]